MSYIVNLKLQRCGPVRAQIWSRFVSAAARVQPERLVEVTDRDRPPALRQSFDQDRAATPGWHTDDDDGRAPAQSVGGNRSPLPTRLPGDIVSPCSNDSAEGIPGTAFARGGQGNALIAVIVVRHRVSLLAHDFYCRRLNRRPPTQPPTADSTADSIADRRLNRRLSSRRFVDLCLFKFITNGTRRQESFQCTRTTPISPNAFEWCRCNRSWWNGMSSHICF